MYDYNYQLNIRNLFNNPTLDDSEQEIVYRDLCRLSYADFRQRVSRLANMLTDLGVKAGDTVSVMDYDSHRYLECYYAIPMIGAVLHTVNVRFSPEQLLFTINHADASVLLVHSDFLPLLEEIKQDLRTIRHFVLINDEEPATQGTLTFSGDYEQLLGEASEDYEFPDLDENTRATTFYTTGTTGMPKGVYFSHRQLVLHTLGAIATLSSNHIQGGFHREDVYMPITPMFHVHAWGIPYVATCLGVKQVYPGRYAPELLLHLIERERVTFSHCVPTIMHMLFSSKEIDSVDLSNWKVIIGGSALPKDLCQKALGYGIDIFSGYGMSETCPILTVAQLSSEHLAAESEEQIERRCKTGRPLPLVDIKLVDEEMRTIPRDGESVGEIVVRSPWLTQGYLKDPANSEVLWRGGYLHTGDVANCDEEGFFKITDRAKDVIKVGGEWVSSLELEDAISLHSSVSEVAVIGVPDARWGEAPLALVVPREKAEVSGKELKKHLKAVVKQGVLNRYALICQFSFVDGIVKTSVGKIDKKILREKFLFAQGE